MRATPPEWTFSVQVMPFADAADYRFNPFDLTKVWPQGEYPLIEVGRMVLDRNPANFFAEVEQSSFNPSNLVPGTGLSPDRMLMARIFSYHDTHLHRIGPNYEQLPINRPQCPVHSYNKDGHMTYHHAGDQPVYAPNSYGGPAADPARGTEIGWDVEAARDRAHRLREASRTTTTSRQPGTLVREVMGDAERDALVVGHRRPRLRRRLHADAAARHRVLVAGRPADRRAGRRGARPRPTARRRRPRRCAPPRSWSTAGAAPPSPRRRAPAGRRRRRCRRRRPAPPASR